MEPDHFHKKLSHLTENQINELINRYYANEKVADLLAFYKIDVRASELVRLFPSIIHNNILCQYCKLPMHSNRVSRNSYVKEETPYCPACKHQNIEHCKCNNCLTKLRDQKIIESNRIKNILSNSLKLENLKPVDFIELEFNELVYVGALLRIGLEEDLSKIKPINDFIEPFAPTQDYQREIIRSLYQANILAIHPCSPVDAFSQVTDDGNYTFNLYKVYYHLNMSNKFGKNLLLNDLMNPTELYEIHEKDAFELWNKIALEECKEYLLYNLNSIGFEYSIGEKTEAILKDILKNFSTSQIYGIIWSCTSNAARYYQEKSISKKQAANSVIGNCQRYAEKALSEGWEPRKFTRSKECPQSALSKFFFNRILQIGDDGFNCVPRIIKSKPLSVDGNDVIH